MKTHLSSHITRRLLIEAYLFSILRSFSCSFSKLQALQRGLIRPLNISVAAGKQLSLTH